MSQAKHPTSANSPSDPEDDRPLDRGPHMIDETLVDLRGVVVRSRTTTILRDIDLRLRPGEALGLFGSNGAGKTTVLRVVATLLLPFSGEGTVLGADVFGSQRYEIRSDISFIGHVPALYPELSLRENIMFAAKVTGHPESDADRVLDEVGLANAADRRVTECSHGMARRAEFARVMMLEPRLLLLDEPHAALDPTAVDLVGHVAASVVDRGGAVIVVSHDLDRAANLIGRSQRVEGGRLV